MSWDDYVCSEAGQAEYAAWEKYTNRMKAEGHKDGCPVFWARDCECGIAPSVAERTEP